MTSGYLCEICTEEGTRHRLLPRIPVVGDVIVLDPKANPSERRRILVTEVELLPVGDSSISAWVTGKRI